MVKKGNAPNKMYYARIASKRIIVLFDSSGHMMTFNYSGEYVKCEITPEDRVYLASTIRPVSVEARLENFGFRTFLVKWNDEIQYHAKIIDNLRYMLEIEGVRVTVYYTVYAMQTR